MIYIKKWMVCSKHSGKNYIVSLCDDGTYACDCMGWIRHFPRANCAHIREVIGTNPAPISKEKWDALKGKKKKVKETLAFFSKVIEAEKATL
jgi:hypothetical protein